MNPAPTRVGDPIQCGVGEGSPLPPWLGYEDAPPLRISHTHSPPPPMAEPFSLRLGHARALTTVQVVIHYPRTASLPQRGGS